MAPNSMRRDALRNLDITSFSATSIATVKRLIVCADDYGLTPAVSEAILELAAHRRVSAFCCVTNSPAWPGAAARLPRQIAPAVSIGLHLNLTDGREWSSASGRFDGPRLPSLASLIGRALSKRLRRDWVDMQLRAQAAAFEAALGTAPRFIDSHQHTHLLAPVRDAVIAFAQARDIAVRNLSPAFGPRDSAPKRIVFRLLGSGALRQALIAHNLVHNRQFGGLQSFRADYDVRSAWVRMLAELSDQALIACHVAIRVEPADPIGRFRVREFEYLSSAQFDEDCRAAGVQLREFAL